MSEKAGSLDVVIPMYNCQNFLVDAVYSILPQMTPPNDHLILIDDGSSDHTLQIAKEIAAREGQVKLVALPTNSGRATACNIGIDLSDSGYIAFQDADDISVAGRLDIQRTFLQNNPGVGVVGTGWSLMDDANLRSQTFSPPSDHEDIVRALRCARPAIHGPTVMLRRAILDDVGGPFRAVIRTAEDQDLWFRLMERDCRFANIRAPLYRYRRHSAQVSSASVQRQIWDISAAYLGHRMREEGRHDPIESWTGYPDVTWVVDNAGPALSAEIAARLTLTEKRGVLDDHDIWVSKRFAGDKKRKLIGDGGVDCRGFRPLLKMAIRAPLTNRWVLFALFIYSLRIPRISDRRARTVEKPSLSQRYSLHRYRSPFRNSRVRDNPISKARQDRLKRNGRQG